MPPAIIEIEDPLRSATRPYIRGRAWRESGTGRRGAVPYEGKRTRRKKGKCGAMGEGASGRFVNRPYAYREEY